MIGYLDGVTTVIWDLDGTVLDSFGYTLDIMGLVFPDFGMPAPTEDELYSQHHGSLEQMLAGVVAGRLEPEEFQQLYVEFLKVDNAHIKDVDEHLFPDAVEAIRAAHAGGLRQIVVTNRLGGAERGNADPRAIVRNSALQGMVEHVVCGNDGPYRKPDRRMLQPLISETGIDLSACAVIGDQAVDAEFAYNLQARPILIARRDGTVAHLDDLQSRIAITPTILRIL